MAGKPTDRPGLDLQTVDWKDVSKRLTFFAKERLGTRGTWEDAEEVAQDALRRWFEKEPRVETLAALLADLGSTVNGFVANRVRKASAKRERAFDPTSPPPAVENKASDEALVEDELVEMGIGRRALDMLLLAVAGDDLVNKSVFLFLEGVETPREQATKLGVPAEEIYKARRRLAGHIVKVREQLQKESGDAE